MIAELIDPVKLGTLGERGANPRIQKSMALMRMADEIDVNLTNLVTEAVSLAGYTNAAARLTRDSLLKNYRIAATHGVLDDDGLAEMRRGRSPTIKSGQHAGDELSVDHIIPRSKVPQLDNVIANLELMPLKTNAVKSDDFGSRQENLLKVFQDAGLFPL